MAKDWLCTLGVHDWRCGPGFPCARCGAPDDFWLEALHDHPRPLPWAVALLLLALLLLALVIFPGGARSDNSTVTIQGIKQRRTLIDCWGPIPTCARELARYFSLGQPYRTGGDSPLELLRIQKAIVVEVVGNKVIVRLAPHGPVRVRRWHAR